MRSESRASKMSHDLKRFFHPVDVIGTAKTTHCTATIARPCIFRFTSMKSLGTVN